MKLEQLDPSDASVLRMYQGVSWRNSNTVLFDDHTVLAFNHPSDSSLAALTNHLDPHARIMDSKDMSTFESLKLAPLS